MAVTRGDTRARILDTAWGLVRERGIGAVTVADIAAATGVSRQLLYVHFENRAGLLVAMARRHDVRSGFAGRAAEAGSLPPVEALERLLRLWFAYLPEILPVARALEAAAINGDEGGVAWRDRMGDLRELFAAAVDAGRPRRPPGRRLDRSRPPPTGSGPAPSPPPSSTWSATAPGRPPTTPTAPSARSCPRWSAPGPDRRAGHRRRPFPAATRRRPRTVDQRWRRTRGAGGPRAGGTRTRRARGRTRNSSGAVRVAASPSMPAGQLGEGGLDPQGGGRPLGPAGARRGHGRPWPGPGWPGRPGRPRSGPAGPTPAAPRRPSARGRRAARSGCRPPAGPARPGARGRRRPAGRPGAAPARPRSDAGRTAWAVASLPAR